MIYDDASHAAQVDRLAEEVRNAVAAWVIAAKKGDHMRGAVASADYRFALSRLIAFAKADKEQR